MITADEIQSGLSGAWRLMMGKADGVRQLDLSADGFWNSFFAMLVALPPLFVMWTSFAIDSAPAASAFGPRLWLLFRLALVDFGAWVIPLIVLGLLATQAGIRDRFVHYVVATNWASAISAWMILPPVLLDRFFPAAAEFWSVLSLCVFIVFLVLLWRLTNAVLDKGPAVATSIFAGMTVLSVALTFLLSAAFGVPTQQGDY